MDAGAARCAVRARSGAEGCWVRASICRVRAGRGARSDGGGSRAAAEAVPVLAEVAPQLADAGRAQLVRAGQLVRPVPQRHVLDDAAVALAQRGQPAREVQPEADLLIDWGLRVVGQGLGERV